MSDTENRSAAAPVSAKASKAATKAEEKSSKASASRVREQPTDTEIDLARKAARPESPKQVKARTVGKVDMWDPDASQYVTPKLGLLEDSAWLRRQEWAGKVIIEG